jgi:hypothetical protein
MRASSLITTVLAGLLLAGCVHEAGEPTPFAPRDAVERPLAEAQVRDGRVRVPAAAIVQRWDMPHVFVLEEGKARVRLVEPGKDRGRYREVLAGLDGDETLVVGDLEEVVDGTPIQQ